MAGRIPTSVLIILFVILWNSGFIGSEYGLPFIDPFTLLFWRYLALSLLLLAYLGVRGRLVWPGWEVVRHMAVVGILAHGVWLLCVLMAIDRKVPAGIVALVIALQPMATGAFSGMITGERTRPMQWLGLLIGFAGVVLVLGARLHTNGSVPWFAYFIPFGSVISITIASLLQRRAETREKPTNSKQPVDVQLFYQSVATLAAVALPALFVENLAADWTRQLVISMVYLVLVISLAAYGLMWLLLQRLSATRVASLFYLGPPVTMVMAWLAYGDQVQPMDLVGLLITMAGIALVQHYGNATRFK